MKKPAKFAEEATCRCHWFPPARALVVGVLVSGILLLAACRSRAAGVPATANSTVDLFKSYMQTRPVIKNIVFDRQSLIGPPAGMPLPAAVAQSATNVQHFQAAWQPDAFFIRRLWELRDADTLVGATTSTAGLIFAGKSDSKLWHIVNTNVYFSTEEKNDDFVVTTCKNAMKLLRSAIDLGAENMTERSLVWSGNSFTGRTDSGKKMSGVLEVKNNLPYSLSVEYEGENYGYVSEYTYTDSLESRLPYGFPNTVYTTFASGKRSIPQTREIFFLIECSNEDLDRSFFAPDRFVGAETQEIIATNKALYVIRNGILGEKLQDLPAAATSRKWRRFFIVVLLGVVFAAPAAFLFARNRKQEQQTTNQRK